MRALSLLPQLVVTLAVLWFPACRASSPLVASPRTARGSAKTRLLLGGHLIDVVSGVVHADPTVVVHRDRIAGVFIGAKERQRARDRHPAADVLDLRHLTLLPGLIDTHSHLTMDMAHARHVADWSAADFLENAAANAKRTLLAGFTTVRDVGFLSAVEEPVDLTLARAIEEGRAQGPRVFASGHLIGARHGHCDPSVAFKDPRPTSPKGGIIDVRADDLQSDTLRSDLAEQIEQAVDEQKRAGAVWIKVCVTAGVLSSEKSIGAQQIPTPALAHLVRFAERNGLPVAAHAHGRDGIIAAISAGVRSIEHVSLASEAVDAAGNSAIDLMRTRRIWYVPTVYAIDRGINRNALPQQLRAKLDHIRPRLKTSASAAITGRVPIAFGTDAGTFPHGQNAREFHALVSLGMEPLEALRAATLGAAELLGRQDLGRIEVGALADIIGIVGNPIEDVRRLENVSFIMKGGSVVSLPVVGHKLQTQDMRMLHPACAGDNGIGLALQ